MEAPKAAGGAWTAPDRPAAAQPEAGPDLSAMMRALRETLPGPSRGRAPAGRGAPVTVPPGARFEERMFADAAGSRRYKVYVPSGYTRSGPAAGRDAARLHARTPTISPPARG